ncbi:MAG: PIN domain-containing protein [Thermoprotei archaeon]|nr:PIN domain-containing protein [Thermoprotei archaeon]
MGLQPRLVLDASVLIEYIIASSPYRQLMEGIFGEAVRGERKLFINSVTLSEALYIAMRVYRAAGLEDPNGEARRFAMWLTSRANIVNVDRDLALDAGELKKRLKIALPDCLVIATAGKVGGSALFKKVKREMLPILKELRRLNVLFLEELLESRR